MGYWPALLLGTCSRSRITYSFDQLCRGIVVWCLTVSFATERASATEQNGQAWANRLEICRWKRSKRLGCGPETTWVGSPCVHWPCKISSGEAENFTAMQLEEQSWTLRLDASTDEESTPITCDQSTHSGYNVLCHASEVKFISKRIKHLWFINLLSPLEGLSCSRPALPRYSNRSPSASGWVEPLPCRGDCIHDLS